MYPLAHRTIEPISMMGLPVHNVGSAEVLDVMGWCKRESKQGLILNLNIFAANLAHDLPWFKKMLWDASLVFCDGDGIRMGCRVLGLPQPPKVTFRVFLLEVGAWCATTGASLFLLGGAPGVAEKAAENLQSRNAKLRISGFHHGFFKRTGAENEGVIEQINSSGTDVLVVCMGMPAQEEWLLKNSHRLKVHACLPGGAAIDYAAGIVSVAPQFMLDHSLEWLYRLWLEPRRMYRRYLGGNPAFLVRLVLWRLGIKRSA